MTLVTASRSVRLLVLVGVCAALVIAALIWFRPPADRPSEMVVHAPVPASESPVRQGWKTIDSRGVRLDVPSAWARLDMTDCEFQFEQWAPPDVGPCGLEGGAAFYRSATFDPAHGPGVRRTAKKRAGAALWGGYVYAGDYAVYVSDTDRDLVREVLDSVRAAGK